MEETIIKVEGMMCNGCERRIQNALMNIENVEKVIANHKEKIVTVYGRNIDINLVKEKINDIGFEVK